MLNTLVNVSRDLATVVSMRVCVSPFSCDVEAGIVEAVPLAALDARREQIVAEEIAAAASFIAT